MCILSDVYHSPSSLLEKIENKEKDEGLQSAKHIVKLANVMF
jgi:hypothetical protein